jgi:hypothetical protein
MDQPNQHAAAHNLPEMTQVEQPRYVKPTIKVMSEKDILNMFQVTQSMGGWWTVPTC